MGAPRTRQPPVAGVTLGAGALLALDRGDRRMTALIRQALSEKRVFRVPAGVIGQAWHDGRRQALLSRFLRGEEVHVVPLDDRLSRAAGELCRATSTADVVDASVVIVAREKRDIIVTSDPADLRRLDPSAAIVAI
jgi:hypothetical protein